MLNQDILKRSFAMLLEEEKVDYITSAACVCVTAVSFRVDAMMLVEVRSVLLSFSPHSVFYIRL